MTVLSNYYGLKAFALLSGIAIAINTTTSAIGPYVAGYLFDKGIRTVAPVISSPSGRSSAPACCCWRAVLNP
jgi:hypothetical protein